MTGGRAYVLDPGGSVPSRVDPRSVVARPLQVHDDGAAADVRRLLRLHRDAGSAVAAELLADEAAALRAVWIVEPLLAAVVPAAPIVPAGTQRMVRSRVPATATQPIRPRAAIAGGA
jgi:glutamate synthase domain-containing protein 3